MIRVKTAIKRLATRLACHEKGATLIVLTMLWVPLVAVTSLAIEYGHALKVRSELQDATDAAALAGARIIDRGDAAVAATIRATLDAHLRPGVKGLPYSVAVEGALLGVRIDASVATRLTAMFGKAAFRFAITSSANLSSPQAAGPTGGGKAASDGDAIEAELVLERGNASPVTVTAADRPHG